MFIQAEKKYRISNTIKFPNSRGWESVNPFRPSILSYIALFKELEIILGIAISETEEIKKMTAKYAHDRSNNQTRSPFFFPFSF